jgi:hypothetical protein
MSMPEATHSSRPPRASPTIASKSQHRPGLGPERCRAGKNRVPDGDGYLLGTGRESFDDEERVARGSSVKVVAVDVVWAGELGDRVW